MNENDIKEELSNNYVSLIASRVGFRLVKGDRDKGVDYIVKYDIVRQMPNGENRELEAPYSCNLQLKATTEASTTVNDEVISYDLKAKNYNDLAFHRSLGIEPLVLILFILPNNEDDWLTVMEDQISLSKCAYWYYPEDTDEVVNSSTKRIHIPITNRLNFDFFENEIRNWVPEWKLTH